MLDELIKRLSIYGVTLVDASIGDNDPLSIGDIDPGYMVSVTLNVSSLNDSSAVLEKMLQGALTELQKQDEGQPF